MSYKVIARKFRPQTFQEVIGQKHVTRTLANAIKENRIAHAFLFTGERGVGKTSIARILAKSLNCHKGLSDQPCGACPSCLEITAGNCIDVHEIDGASNTGVDDIRVLRENARYMPSRDRYKIYIIDEVHMLSTSAFNALLKTLEEPPAHVIFIFATTEPQKIPDTIISRCLRFDFKRIPAKEIIDHLEQIAKGEQIQISRNGLFLIAREAEGSMRDSQTILERAISYCGSTIADADLEEMLGHVDRQFIYRIVDAVLAGDSQACIEGLAAAYEFGVDLRRLYYNLLHLLRDLTIIKSTREYGHLIEAADQDMKKLEELAGLASAEELLRLFRLCFAAEPDVTRSAFSRIAVEICLLEMAHLKRLLPVEDILSRIDSLQKQLGAPQGSYTPAPSRPQPAAQRHEPMPAPGREQKAPEQTAPPSQQGVASGKGAADLLAFIRQSSMPIYSRLTHAQIHIAEDGTIRFDFPAGDMFMESMREPDTEKKLRDICSSFFQKQVQIAIAANREKKKTVKEHESKEQLREKRQQQVMHNPVIQKVIDTFNGKIVDIRTDL